MQNSVDVGVDELRQITVFLGAPGSGKGTQAKRLSQTSSIQHVSTGDLLRSAIARKTAIGEKAKEFTEKGNLVPDAIMIGIIEEHLNEMAENTQVVLDGFPRTVVQAEALDQAGLGNVEKAVLFQIADPVLVNRLTGRRICQVCGALYHIIEFPPKREGICDQCGGRLLQRVDDAESVVHHRLQVFHSQNSSLTRYYQDRNRLVILDANRSVEQVQKDLLNLLGIHGSH